MDKYLAPGSPGKIQLRARRQLAGLFLAWQTRHDRIQTMSMAVIPREKLAKILFKPSIEAFVRLELNCKQDFDV